MFNFTPRQVIRIACIAIVLFLILFGLDKYVSSYGINVPSSSLIILWLAVILFYGKISGAIERIGMPSVLGELIMGAILGNIALVGIHFLDPVKTDPTINFLMLLGTIILFFQAGLAINLSSLGSFFWKALGLAILGLIFSICAFYYALPLFVKDLSPMVILYMALTLSPTGAGVTARIFQDLGKLKSKSSQLIISSGALDNIICFIMQAILVAFIYDKTIHYEQTGLFIVKVLGLILAIILLGRFILPFTVKFLAGIYSERSLEFAFAFGMGLFAAYFAQSIGISPVIGALLVGIVIAPDYFALFKDSAVLTQIENMISAKKLFWAKAEKSANPLKQIQAQDFENMFTTPAFLLVSVFFVVTGMKLDLKMFIEPQYIMAAIFFTVIAFATKMLGSLIVERRVRSITGIGMSPRGVTTLVFAGMGQSAGILTPDLVSLIVMIVMMTTFIAPIIITQMNRVVKE